MSCRSTINALRNVVGESVITMLTKRENCSLMGNIVTVNYLLLVFNKKKPYKKKRNASLNHTK